MWNISQSKRNEQYKEFPSSSVSFWIHFFSSFSIVVFFASTLHTIRSCSTNNLSFALEQWVAIVFFFSYIVCSLFDDSLSLFNTILNFCSFCFSLCSVLLFLCVYFLQFLHRLISSRYPFAVPCSSCN